MASDKALAWAKKHNLSWVPAQAPDEMEAAKPAVVEEEPLFPTEPGFYAGTGVPETPRDVLALMEKLAAKLASLGWTLRHGHCVGPDRAMERGARRKAVAYLPWAGYGVKPYKDDRGTPVLGGAVLLSDGTLLGNYARLEAAGIRDLAMSPSLGTRKLHGRNLPVLLGHEEQGPWSKALLTWFLESCGEPIGTVGPVVRLARLRGIPVVNLASPRDRARAEDWLGLAKG